jgi:hypothetical protein
MPTGSKGMATVLGEMTHGIALARTNQISAAKAALARLDPAADALVKTNAGSDYFSKMIRSLVTTAQFQLRAELALVEKHADEALAQQAKAATAAYDAEGTEPPMLAGGPRRRLGAMQLQIRQYSEAEKSYREDLTEHPGSGWSLHGLNVALLAQGKMAEAKAVKSDLDKSWALADVQLREGKN